MTLIAAAVGAHGEVSMSCDSDNVDGDGRPWPNARKVLTLDVEGGGQALLGHSGRASVHDRVRIRLPRQGLPVASAFDGPDGWADALAESVEQLARDSPSLAQDGEVHARWRAHSHSPGVLPTADNLDYVNLPEGRTGLAPRRDSRIRDEVHQRPVACTGDVPGVRVRAPGTNDSVRRSVRPGRQWRRGGRGAVNRSRSCSGLVMPAAAAARR
jgi:hypothetical protein